MSRILVVEDDARNRKLFRDILQFHFEVDETESAEGAIDYLKVHRPDLILMDIQLPGMDGISLVRQLKANPGLAGIPVIAISALVMTHDMEQARTAGCVDYITKPITDDLGTFLERIDRPMKAALGTV